MKQQVVHIGDPTWCQLAKGYVPFGMFGRRASKVEDVTCPECLEAIRRVEDPKTVHRYGRLLARGTKTSCGLTGDRLIAQTARDATCFLCNARHKNTYMLPLILLAMFLAWQLLKTAPGFQ